MCLSNTNTVSGNVGWGCWSVNFLMIASRTGFHTLEKYKLDKRVMNKACFKVTSHTNVVSGI